MKILESYKDIAKSMLIEHAWDRKFGEPLPTLEDVMKEADVDDEKMIKYKAKDGEQKQMKAGSAKTMPKDHPAKQAWDKMADIGGEEEPKGKGLEPDDFERDFDDSEPEDKPFGGDTGKDADSEFGKDYVSKFQGTDEPSGEEKEGWDNVEDIMDASHEDILDDPQSIYNAFDDMEQAGIKVPDWMFDKAADIRDGDGDENDAEEIQSVMQNIYDRPEDYKESIIINGKKYRAIKESVESKKHLLREMYERIGGK